MIVMNTLNAAVTEYDLVTDSITPSYMGDEQGLYLIGGDLDDDKPIVSEILTGGTEWGDSLKKRPELVYFAMRGEGTGEAVVQGRSTEYRYTFPILEKGQSRARPGKGIRENYLAFGFSNPDGQYFEIDRIEVMIGQSSERRAG